MSILQGHSTRYHCQKIPLQASYSHWARFYHAASPDSDTLDHCLLSLYQYYDSVHLEEFHGFRYMYVGQSMHH